VEAPVELTIDGETVEIDHGAVVIAAITSCTNTSNPAVMIGAGSSPRRPSSTVSRALVKTSLAPGSKVVTEYYEGRPHHLLEALGFNTVGYGCDLHRELGPLPEEVSPPSSPATSWPARSSRATATSGPYPSRGEGGTASPPLVVAYAPRADGHRHHHRGARHDPQ
jgi:aconitate hydratase